MIYRLEGVLHKIMERCVINWNTAQTKVNRNLNRTSVNRFSITTVKHKKWLKKSIDIVVDLIRTLHLNSTQNSFGKTVFVMDKLDERSLTTNQWQFAQMNGLDRTS